MTETRRHKIKARPLSHSEYDINVMSDNENDEIVPLAITITTKHFSGYRGSDLC